MDLQGVFEYIFEVFNIDADLLHACWVAEGPSRAQALRARCVRVSERIGPQGGCTGVCMEGDLGIFGKDI